MKSIYDMFMIPLERSGIRTARKEMLSNVKGTVLEIGSGTGVNAAYYNFNEIQLTATDVKISKYLKQKYQNKANLKECSVELLPFEDKTFDYIVHTLVFCSVHDIHKGMSEIRRVLKDDGKLIFIEHVLPKKNPLKKIFQILTPLWRKVASNCHLNRDFESLLIEHNFKVQFIKAFNRQIFVYGIANKS